mgnify:FL=1
MGVLPLSSAKHAAFLHHEVPGIHLTEPILQRMNEAGEQSARTGIEIALELIAEMRDVVSGIYLMPR